MKINFFLLFTLFATIIFNSCSHQDISDEVTADFKAKEIKLTARLTAAPLRTLYVATTGLDTNSGSFDKPFKTINKAAEVAIAGDLIIVKAGTYKPVTRINVANSGTTTNPITFQAEGTVIIDGVNCADGNSTDRKGLFCVEGASATSRRSDIVIDGFRIINAKWAGFYMRFSNGINVRNCSTDLTGASGIVAAQSSYIYVFNNTVQRACTISSPAEHTNECITMASVANFEVGYNTVSDRMVDVNVGGEGIDAKNACLNGKIHHNIVFNLIRVGIYVDGYEQNLNNIDVYANKVYNSVRGGITVGSEEGGVVSDVKVHDNIVHNIQRIGIRIAGYVNNGPLQNISVYQNTVVRCGIGNTTASWENCGIMLEADNALNSNFIIRNNILAENTSQMRWKNQSYATINNNLVFGNTNVTGTGAITTNPMFVNSSSANFALSTGSPAINTAIGSPMSVTDFNNYSRGASPDLGALEKQ